MSWIASHSPPALPTLQGAAQAAVDIFQIGAPLVGGNVPAAVRAAAEQFGRSYLRDRGYDPDAIESVMRGNYSDLARRILFRYGEAGLRQFVNDRYNAIMRIRGRGEVPRAISVASSPASEYMRNPFARRLHNAVFGGEYKRPRDDPSSHSKRPRSKSRVDPVSVDGRVVVANPARYSLGRRGMAYVRSSRKRRHVGRSRKYGSRKRRVGSKIGRSRYTVWKSLVSGRQVPGMRPRYQPKFSKSHKDGSITIRNREWLWDIAPTSAWAVIGYINLNPGAGGLGAWAASIASNFQVFKFRKLKFEYVTSSGYVNTSSGSLGQILMAINYNADEGQFTSKQAMLQSRTAAAGVPSSNLSLLVDRKHFAQKEYYVNNLARHPTTGTPMDKKTYEPGNFQFATYQTNTGGALLGEVFCEYEITLSKPTAAYWRQPGSCHYQLGSVTNAKPLGSAAPTCIFDDWAASPSQGTGSLIATGTTLSSNGIGYSSGSTIYQSSAGQYGVEFTTSGLVITLPVTVGVTGYQLYYQVVGASTALTGPALVITNGSTGVGAVANNDFGGSGGPQGYSTNSGTTSTVLFLVNNITVTNPSLPVTITFGAATLPTSVSSADLWITQLSANAN